MNPMHQHLELPTEESTQHIAQRFAHALSAPLILGFSGPIGAGKTTFIRAMLRELGIQGAIKSPTYALVESYETNRLHIHHFDLYRIQEEDELEYIGFRDYFTEKTICCIEWPERMHRGSNIIDIHLSLQTKLMGRTLHITATSPRGQAVLSSFSESL